MNRNVAKVMMGLIISVAFGLTGCGGGGGDDATTTGITLNLKETVPSGTVVSKVSFTMFLPGNVTPEFSSGTTLADGVVSATGIFAGASMDIPIYTPPTVTEDASITVTFTSNAPNGVSLASGLNAFAQFRFRLLTPFSSVEAAAIGYRVNPVQIFDASGNDVSGVSVWTST